MKITRHKQLLPVLLLTAYCVDSVFTAFTGRVELAGETYDFDLTIKHYIAFGAIALNLLTYIYFRPFYKYVLGLTIVLGLFNLMTFSALEIWQSIRLGNLKISFQPSAFWAGIWTYGINFKKINEFIIDKVTTKRSLADQERDEKRRFAEEVEKFKVKYEGYSIETLAAIVQARKYVPEALEAARELINEQKNAQKSDTIS